MQQPILYIIVLHFGDMNDTLACLESIHKCIGNNWRRHICVVNNTGSMPRENAQKGGTEEWIHAPDNLGYAGGMNLGITRALENGADYVLLLNNDVVLHPDALIEFKNGVALGSGKGIWGGTIFFRDQPERIWFSGGIIQTWLGRTQHRRQGELHDEKWEKPMPVDYITGAMLLVSRAVFERAGQLDTSLFLYFEDTEFSLRARRYGFQPTLVPAVRAWHKVGAWQDTESRVRYLYFQTRNRYLVLCGQAPFLKKLTTRFMHVMVFSLWRALKTVVGFKPDAVLEARAILRGLRDSLKNVRGRGEYADV